MPKFQYKAVTPEGELTQGEMEAPDRAAVIARLQSEHHVPIRADELGRSAAAGDAAYARLVRRLAQPVRLPGWRGGGRRSLRFSRSLAMLLGAGLPLDRALSVMLEVAGPGREGELIRSLLERVRGGATLSAAMASHDEVFGRFAVALVRAGEAGGLLAQALERLATQEERARQVAETVRSALIYPIVLLFMAVLSVVLLMVFVIPQFRDLFSEAARELPLATRVVFGSAELLQRWGWLLLLLLVAGGLAFRSFARRPEGRLRVAAWRLRLPLAGDLERKIETERLTRSLGTLVGSGVALPQAIALAAEGVNNRVLAECVAEIARRVSEGASFARALAASGRFPVLAVQLVRVGEETGRLKEMLTELAEIYSGEVQATVKRLVSLIEPVLIIGLGALIAGIMMSVLAAVVGLNALAL